MKRSILMTAAIAFGVALPLAGGCSDDQREAKIDTPRNHPPANPRADTAGQASAGPSAGERRALPPEQPAASTRGEPIEEAHRTAPTDNPNGGKNEKREVP